MAVSDSTAKFPRRFVNYATRHFGEKGEMWLAELPGILEKCRAKWGLALGPLVDEIKVNYVGYARMPSGEEVVLKVGVPHREFSTEMEALAIYEGRGINRLIDSDEELNAMVLERISPGTLLNNLEDRDAQAEVVAQIIRDLHRTPPPSGHNLPNFSKWAESAHRDARECDDQERARPFLDQLPRVLSILDSFSDPGEPQMLLHGDLHHWNVLLDRERGWMAIDPKGVVGASCLEVGRFIGNAFSRGADPAEMRRILEDTIRILSDRLGQNQDRIFAGALCDYVVASSWGLKYQSGPGERQESEEELAVLLDVGAGSHD